MLTLKTVTLLTILSAQRIQTAHLLDIHNMLVGDSVVKISIGDKLKQTRPGYHLNELQFPAYNPHNELCQVLVVKEYLARMKPLHGNIMSLGLAGLDLTRFKPHSVWAASASAASHENVLLGTILRRLVKPIYVCQILSQRDAQGRSLCYYCFEYLFVSNVIFAL